MAIILILALALTGGVAVSAQTSLPGDALYGFKTNVNEEIRAALAVGAKANAELEAKLAAERAEEAAQLQAEGRLDAETRAELSSAFNAHIENARQHIDELRASGNLEAAAEASAKVEAVLRESLRGEINADGTINLGIIGQTTGALESEVSSALNLFTGLKINLEAQADLEAEAEANSSADADADNNTNADADVNGGVNVDVKANGSLNVY